MPSRIVVAAMMLACGVALADGDGEPRDPQGWRQLKWGMSVSEVKAALRQLGPTTYRGSCGQSPSSLCHEYTYRERLGGETETLRLVFLEGQLSQVQIQLKALTRTQFLRVADTLARKYGCPDAYGANSEPWIFVIHIGRTRITFSAEGAHADLIYVNDGFAPVDADRNSPKPQCDSDLPPIEKF